jgi:hypothetical protein
MYHDYGPTNEAEDGWLITPGVYVEEEGVYSINFFSYNMWAQFYDKNSVWISYEGNNPLEHSFSSIWDAEAVSQQWAEDEAHFYSEGQDTIYFAFRYQGSNAHTWYLDDIALSSFNQQEQYLLTVTSNSTTGGTTTGHGLYDHNQEVIVTATPAEGYDFINWTDKNGNVVSNDEVWTISMPNDNYWVKANFDVAGNILIDENVQIVVYPNPASENMTISSSNIMERLSLLNQNGKIIRHVDHVGAREYTLSVNDINPGLYFIIIQNADKAMVRKIQVVK